jgi:hypothetical protein
MRVSLCVICGNEEAIIERMLTSFAGAFDQLSLVRAIGTTAPDATADKAAAWCAANGKDYVFTVYENDPDFPFEHVDDFAAARNLAFEKGDGDWLIWCDCDDIIDNAAGLRAALEAASAQLVRFPYDVVGTGKRPMRERAIRRDAFNLKNRWRFPVHENLRVVRGTTIADLEAPVWVHQPKLISVTNRKRNRAILSKALANASTNYFYVHQEWTCEGNKFNAIKFGKLALACPDLDPSFRYETNLNLCKLSSDNQEALAYALEAFAVLPWCREAKAMLALTLIDRGAFERALHFAQQMDETPLPPPEKRPWTHEPKWYGWAGNDILARCLRLAGRMADAKAVQRRTGKPVISLLHATRGRAAQANATRSHWLNLAKNPERIEHIFAVDADDAESVKMSRQFQSVISTKQSCVAAWNMAAKVAEGDLLVQLSDDWIACPNWDEMLLAEIANAGKGLSDEAAVAIHDGSRGDELLCMAILTRGRLDRQGGELFYEGYQSVFSDNEFSHRAWRDGIVIDARTRVMFHHRHPLFSKGQWDATYKHNNTKERYDSGLELFKQRNPDADAKWSTP